jgi:hypothetical protein
MSPAELKMQPTIHLQSKPGFDRHPYPGLFELNYHGEFCWQEFGRCFPNAFCKALAHNVALSREPAVLRSLFARLVA